MKVDSPATPQVDHEIAYSWDSLSRLTSVASIGKITSYESACLCGSLSNPVRIRYPNGTEARMTYDSANRLVKLRNAVGRTNAALSYFEYTYDGMNNWLTMRDIMGEHRYSYDKLYRLTGVDYPRYPDQAYTYDPAGNRLTLAGVKRES